MCTLKVNAWRQVWVNLWIDEDFSNQLLDGDSLLFGGRLLCGHVLSCSHVPLVVKGQVAGVFDSNGSVGRRAMVLASS